MTLVPMPQPPTAGGTLTRMGTFDVLDRSMELAEVVGNTDFVPRGLRGNAPAIVAAILYGHEIGLEPMTSLATIAVIEGKPHLAAEAQRALITAGGHELWLEESTNTRATWAGRRRESKQTTRVTWTLDDAKRARLAGKPAWQLYPRAMLSARASAELARAVFPDVIRGMAATEELDDFELVAGSPATPDPEQRDDTPPATSTRKRAPSRRRPSSPPAAASSMPAGEAEHVEYAPAPVRAPANAGKAEAEKPADTTEADAPPNPPNPAAFARLFATFGDKGITDRDERLAYTERVLGRTVGSSKELTGVDVTRLLEALDAEPAAAKPEDGEQVDEDGFEQPPLPE